MQAKNFAARCRAAVSHITNALSGSELTTPKNPNNKLVGVSLVTIDQHATEIEDEVAAAIVEIKDVVDARVQAGIDAGTLNPARGYFHVHRFVAHLLPRRFRWTVIGIEIIDEVLRNNTSIAPYFASGEWEQAIENNIAETKVRENERVRRQLAYHAETEQQRVEMGEEIVRLLRARDYCVRNYSRLYRHLHRLLPMGFRGSRGVGVIHAAMTDKLKYASHWQEWMEADYKHSLLRDEELRLARRARNQERYRAMNKTIEELRSLNESEDPFDLDDSED